MILKVKNDLFDYPNRFIMQMKNGFKFSLDSLLLSEFVNLKKSDKFILDMCSGNAPVALVLSLKTNALIVCFEIQKQIANLAKESVSINNLNSQIKIINDDIKNIEKYYNIDTFDIITCNPPYFKVINNNSLNINDFLTLARHEITIDLESIFNIAYKFLKDKAAFYLVHRSGRLDEIILYASKYKLNVKKLQFITTKKGARPSIVLVKCVKNSKYGIKVEKEICVDKLCTYQHLFEGR